MSVVYLTLRPERFKHCLLVRPGLYVETGQLDANVPCSSGAFEGECTFQTVMVGGWRVIVEQGVVPICIENRLKLI